MLSQVLNIATVHSARTEPSATAAKGTQDAPDAFGSVLARQIDKRPATATSPKDSAKDSKAAANAQPAGDTATNHDNPPDASSMVQALFGKTGVKTPVAKEKGTDSGTNTDPATQVAAVAVNPLLLPGNPLVATITPSIASGNAGASLAAGVDSGIDSATHIKGSASLKELIQTGSAHKKADLTAGKFVPAEEQAALTGGKPVLTGEKLAPFGQAVAPATLPDMTAEVKAGSASLKIADLAANAPSAQVLAQSAASSLQPGLPVTAGNTIAAPLNSRAWPEEFAQKVSWISTQQNQVAELHLNPPDLGPMSVVLSVTDNQATALFTSPHSAVRDAIENALPKLRDSLADNGIMLGNATVSDQTPRDSGAGNFMNHRGGNSRTEIAGTAQPAPITMPLTTTSRHNGMVDTFA